LFLLQGSKFQLDSERQLRNFLEFLFGSPRGNLNQNKPMKWFIVDFCHSLLKNNPITVSVINRSIVSSIFGISMNEKVLRDGLDSNNVTHKKLSLVYHQRLNPSAMYERELYWRMCSAAQKKVFIDESSFKKSTPQLLIFWIKLTLSPGLLARRWT